MTDSEIERLVVETHATVATLVERSGSIDNKLSGVIRRLDVTNGSVAEIKEEQYRQQGALAALRWMLAMLIAVAGVGVGVGSLLRAVVER